MQAPIYFYPTALMHFSTQTATVQQLIHPEETFEDDRRIAARI